MNIKIEGEYWKEMEELQKQLRFNNPIEVIRFLIATYKNIYKFDNIDKNIIDMVKHGQKTYKYIKSHVNIFYKDEEIYHSLLDLENMGFIQTIKKNNENIYVLNKNFNPKSQDLNFFKILERIRESGESVQIPQDYGYIEISVNQNSSLHAREIENEIHVKDEYDIIQEDIKNDKKMKTMIELLLYECTIK